MLTGAGGVSCGCFSAILASHHVDAVDNRRCFQSPHTLFIENWAYFPDCLGIQKPTGCCDISDNPMPQEAGFRRGKAAIYFKVTSFYFPERRH